MADSPRPFRCPLCASDDLTPLTEHLMRCVDCGHVEHRLHYQLYKGTPTIRLGPSRYSLEPVAAK